MPGQQLTKEESNLAWHQQQKLIEDRTNADARSKYRRFLDWWNGEGDIDDIPNGDQK